MKKLGHDDDRFVPRPRPLHRPRGNLRGMWFKSVALSRFELIETARQLLRRGGTIRLAAEISLTGH